MSERLTVMITPSPAGVLWRDALVHRAGLAALPFADVGPEGPPDEGRGLFFAHHRSAMAVAAGPRLAITDTSAVANHDPAQPASVDDIIQRSRALCEAEGAIRDGALRLDAHRHNLEMPLFGAIERNEGPRYRIHPLASESPLALFDKPISPGAVVDWAPHWFVFSDKGGLDEPRWIDLTGRMRPLVYGPYIHLPAGRWRVEVSVFVDPERAHAPLLLEWGSGTEFCRLMAEIRRPGAYKMKLDRIWPEMDAAQLRLWTLHPVFEGRLSFQGVRVTCVAPDDPSPLTPTDHLTDAQVV